MKRRSFLRQLTIATAFSLPITARPRSFSKPATQAAAPRHVKPRRLRSGDTVGLITPGSYLDDEGLQKAVTNLESLGLRVKMGAHLRAERGFTAGSDPERLADLHAMFADPQVAGVWCARGGYGCSRLLPAIDYKLIRRNPKVLVGYSDITALHQAIHRETGLVTFHGPVAASDFTDYTRAQVQALLFDGAGSHVIFLSEANRARTEPEFQPAVIAPGRARGVLAGGNLSLLSALAGTGYDLDAAGKLLFIEDVGEKPYRIDRMLTQLRQNTDLRRAAGIALGVFSDCEAKPGERSLTLLETLTDRLGDLGVPVVYGLSFGHIADQCTLPVGIAAELDVERMSVTVLEAGVM